MAGGAGSPRITRNGRVRKLPGGWVFETQPEYALQTEEWEPFFQAPRKQDVLAVAIKSQLNGWIREWHEENDG